MTANVVLVVEHIPRTLTMLRQVLEAEGHTVLAAHDAHEALAQMAEVGRQVDLVIQDLSVPDMEPAELTQRLRACPGGAEVPILASSGFLGGQHGAQALGADFSALLVKPFEAARVAEVVNTHLPARTGASGQPGRDRPLLLVDDDPIQLKLVAFQLRRAGFAVATAASGLEALATAREQLPAVIVSDVLMPRMDGFQLCLEARRDPALAGVPVVLLSAQYLEQSDRELAAKVGANRLIPRTPRADLIRAVVQALEEKVVRRPAAAVEVLREEHFHRVIRQLERQTVLAAGMAQTSAIQAAQLAVLGGVANALAQRADVETVLRDVLPGCFDPAGISKAVIYLADPVSGELAVRHAFGFGAEDGPALADGFGCLPVLRQVLETGVPRRFSAGSDPGGAGRALLEGSALAAAFVVPLGPARSRIGTLLAGTPTVPSESSDPSAFLRALGGQIGHALTLSSTFAELGNAVAARDEFIAVAAHELRTPLTALTLSLRGLAGGPGIDTRPAAAPAGTRETKISRALRQMARLTWLVENLLDVSRIGSRREMTLQREPIDLGEIVREVAEQLRDSVGDSSLITVDAPAGVVGSWDRFRLRTIVSNLLSNAFKFSAAQPVHLAVSATAGMARLTVSDQGIGIRPEDRERIFLRFEQAASSNYGGLGIGLWITRQTVVAHGGRIWVDSEVGKGSVFTVELPLTEGPPAPGAREARPPTS